MAQVRHRPPVLVVLTLCFQRSGVWVDRTSLSHPVGEFGKCYHCSSSEAAGVCLGMSMISAANSRRHSGQADSGPSLSRYAKTILSSGCRTNVKEVNVSTSSLRRISGPGRADGALYLSGSCTCVPGRYRVEGHVGQRAG